MGLGYGRSRLQESRLWGSRLRESKLWESRLCLSTVYSDSFDKFNTHGSKLVLITSFLSNRDNDISLFTG